jgi:hypothetical protein
MKTRLAIFVASLLLFPYLGMLLSGGKWEELSIPAAATATVAPLLITLVVLLGYTLLCNFIVARRSGHDPFRLQRNYFFAVAVASSVLGWLLVYLDHYAANWLTEGNYDLTAGVAQTVLFALLAPAVLSTRALLGSSGRLLKYLSRALPLPAPNDDILVLVLAPLTLAGLLGGAAWPSAMFWLLWSAPLLLLVMLQLLWQEGTIFSGLARGDWGRVVCAALAGLIVGNIVAAAFQLAGGTLILQLPNAAFAQLGYALFGLLCLQLGDVIAENWRGKTRAQVFKKKAFPIPVVVKKD